MKSDPHESQDAKPEPDLRLPDHNELAAAARELSAKFPGLAFVVVAAVGTEVMHTTNMVNNDQLRAVLRIIRRTVKKGDFLEAGEVQLH